MARPAGRKSPPAPRRLAAIDIGSNSIRQLIADVSSAGAIRVVDEMKAHPRLGMGVHRTGALDDGAMDRAIEALGRMADLARQLDAQRVASIATSAVREASNGATFLRRVRQETGLTVHLIDGEREARLSFRSALAHFDLGRGRAIVMDLGGGSLELSLSADGLIERLVSLPFGAVRMTERFLERGGRPRDLRALRDEVREALRTRLSARDWRGAQIIGSGGTFTNLAGMSLARRGIAAQTVHATRVRRSEIEHILDLLATLPPAERAQIPGLSPARADIIVAALAVVAEVLARVDARGLVVSGFGIREGLLLEMAEVRPVRADPGEGRERSVREFAERCHYEAPHAAQVQRIALQLFDALGTRLGLGAADRGILADAALLHDIGYHINYDRHHKHSYHLILHAGLLGVRPEEQVLIANVARYHRGATPSPAQRNFAALDKPLRRRVRRIAALLRLADGFDRGHVGAVAQVKVRLSERAIRLTVVPKPGAHTVRLDLWGASRKAAPLADLLGVPFEIVGPDGAVLPGEDAAD